MGGGEIISITELLMIAVAVAIITRYIKLPYTVALVLVGLIIGFFSKYFFIPGLSKELIMMIFLPPLLFEGALNMDLQTLFDRKLPVGLLAFSHDDRFLAAGGSDRGTGPRRGAATHPARAGVPVTRRWSRLSSSDDAHLGPTVHR